MRSLFIILTIISAARGLPLPSAQDDLFSDSGYDSGYDSLYDSGSDSSSFLSDGSSDTFLMAGSDTGSSKPDWKSMYPDANIPDGWDPDNYDIPWTIVPGGKDSSWTGADHPSSQSDGRYTNPEDDFIQGERGEDYSGPTYGITVNSDVNGPTSFKLSPEQQAAVISAGTLVIGGVTWVYNSVTGVISGIYNGLNGLTSP